tara:strand:+ start:297 stop:449 length:153 start_codon:yes stop_codon:yes gene_type:complete
MLKTNTANVPADIQNKLINTANASLPEAKVSPLYPDSNCVVHEDDVGWGG